MMHSGRHKLLLSQSHERTISRTIHYTIPQIYRSAIFVYFLSAYTTYRCLHWRRRVYDSHFEFPFISLFLSEKVWILFYLPIQWLLVVSFVYNLSNYFLFDSFIFLNEFHLCLYIERNNNFCWASLDFKPKRQPF